MKSDILVLQNGIVVMQNNDKGRQKRANFFFANRH